MDGKMSSKKIFFAAGFFLVLPLIAAFFIIISNLNTQKFPNEVCFNNSCFKVEIAKTTAEQEKGLMFRESLPNDQGMLFVFGGQGIYDFWMKNTLIPLDMIWMNQNKEVVFVANNVQPCKEDPCSIIIPDAQASYVLEINGGMAKKIGLTVGSKATFSNN